MRGYQVTYEFDGRTEKSVIHADNDDEAVEIAKEAIRSNGADDFILTVDAGDANWIKSHNMIGLLEEKDNIGSVKDVSLANMTLTGYLAHFGSVDHGNDIIKKGAFTKTLTDNAGKQFFLNFHNFDQPHAKFTTLKEDDFGLYFEVKMVPGVSYSMDTLRLYDAGVIEEQSIGFQAIQKHIDKKSGVRTLQEVYLAEGSNVTIAMNSNAKFTGFKGLTKCNDQIKRMISFLRNGTATDETFVQLEIGLKQLQSYSFELGKKQALESEGEPDNSTQTKAEPQQLEIIKSFTNSLILK